MECNCNTKPCGRNICCGACKDNVTCQYACIPCVTKKEKQQDFRPSTNPKQR